MLAIIPRQPLARTEKRLPRVRLASAGGDDTTRDVASAILSRITDTVVDDILVLPDSELMSEIAGDEAKLAAEARHVFARALREVGSPMGEIVPLHPRRERSQLVKLESEQPPIGRSKYFYPFFVSTALAIAVIVFCITLVIRVLPVQDAVAISPLTSHPTIQATESVLPQPSRATSAVPKDVRNNVSKPPASVQSIEFEPSSVGQVRQVDNENAWFSDSYTLQGFRPQREYGPKEFSYPVQTFQQRRKGASKLASSSER